MLKKYIYLIEINIILLILFINMINSNGQFYNTY